MTIHPPPPPVEASFPLVAGRLLAGHVRSAFALARARGAQVQVEETKMFLRVHFAVRAVGPEHVVRELMDYLNHLANATAVRS